MKAKLFNNEEVEVLKLAINNMKKLKDNKYNKLIKKFNKRIKELQ